MAEVLGYSRTSEDFRMRPSQHALGSVSCSQAVRVRYLEAGSGLTVFYRGQQQYIIRGVLAGCREPVPNSSRVVLLSHIATSVYLLPRQLVTHTNGG